MSTDVYFDFQSAEVRPLQQAFYAADNTNGRALPLLELWSSKIRELEKRDGTHTHYDPCRVAYLSNLLGAGGMSC